MKSRRIVEKLVMKRRSRLLSSSSSQLSARSEEALALHVEEQLPLNAIQPCHEEVELLRRSSRSMSNKCGNPAPGSSRNRGRLTQRSALSGSECRRSPRFASSLSAPALTWSDGRSSGTGLKKRCRALLDGEGEGEGRVGKKGNVGQDVAILRRYSRRNGDKDESARECLSSPIVKCALIESRHSNFTEKSSRSRFVKIPAGNGREKAKKSSASKKSSGESDVKRKLSSHQETMCALIELPQSSETRNSVVSFRRSPRLNEGSKEDPKFEILVLPVKRAFANNCLKSRNLKVQLLKQRMGIDVTLRSASGVTELPDASELTDERKRVDSEMTNGKCLRSRKVQFRLNEIEVIKKDNDSSEGLTSPKNLSIARKNVKTKKKGKTIVCCFIGEPLPEEVAQSRWQWRYELKHKKTGHSWKMNADEEDEIILNVDRHYAQARIGNCVLDIGDCVCVKGEGEKKHIGRILEFFKTTEGEDYFRVQWFFRAKDTVLKDAASSHDKRRLFYSTLTNDNVLDCIISKVRVVKIPPLLCLKSIPLQPNAFYYDMEYSVEYSTFHTLFKEPSTDSCQSFLLTANHPDENLSILPPLEILHSLPSLESPKPELWLLDLYSGCGGMSTGLCVGAKLSGTNLVTKWAVDQDSSACDSLKLNHPNTQVRNETADDFIELLRQWEKLCNLYLLDLERIPAYELDDPPEAKGYTPEPGSDECSEEYEVSYLIDICFGDPCENGERGLHFKVRWKGYGPDEDTWEPIEGLSNCEERIQDFVRKGHQSKILPLPGDADVICGGPPCQGISGYNRFRNTESPLADERNRQIIVFMDIVQFLKPKYVLMENVVDIIRFNKGSLARYALSRLVSMRYQARLGTIASGCYGLPQFRLRVFIWGAHPSETLPQFPLPTHDVVVRYWPPVEFERNVVAYDEGQPRMLEEAIVLRDSISDLPPVTNYEDREEMEYNKSPETEFQSYIRLSKDQIMGTETETETEPEPTVPVLHDHRPLQLSKHDILRVSQIPHRKGANFRDLPGLIISRDNAARRDPTTGPVMLPTGKLLVPECVLNCDNGRSKRPYSRVWWDETVSTLLTIPNIRRQGMMHPEQDRLLTIRECARLQGFPDFYRFCGTVKERYCQIGNAVSVPVARALGYALGVAHREVIGDGPLMTLPPKFGYHKLSGDAMELK